MFCLRKSFLFILVLLSNYCFANTFIGGQTIIPAGKIITSENSKYKLIMQTDGNLVLYRSDNTVRWATYTFQPGSYAVMQADGNFVLYNSSTMPLWNTTTHSNPGAFLGILNDGNLVVYNSAWTPLWSIGAEYSSPKYAGDVVGRDNNSLSILGHLGIFDGRQDVVEIVPSGTNVVKITPLTTFKATSTYWGAASTYIPNYNVIYCYEKDCPNWRWLKPYGNSEKISSRIAITRSAYQSHLIGADYTIAAEYVKALPSEWPWPSVRGQYRCDSFVVAMYMSTIHNYNNIYNEPIDSKWRSQMESLFNAIRYPKNIFDKIRTFRY